MEANPFIADPGPEFDPEQAEQETPAIPLRAIETHWQPERISRIFKAQGLLTHEAIGVGHEDWLWRESELAAIAEPAANVLNKHPVTHAAAAVSDELTVGAVMLDYSLRSIRERSRVLRERKRAQQQEHQEPQPITGVNAQGDPVSWRVPGEE